MLESLPVAESSLQDDSESMSESDDKVDELRSDPPEPPCMCALSADTTISDKFTASPGDGYHLSHRSPLSPIGGSSVKPSKRWSASCGCFAFLSQDPSISKSFLQLLCHLQPPIVGQQRKGFLAQYHSVECRACLQPRADCLLPSSRQPFRPCVS